MSGDGVTEIHGRGEGGPGYGGSGTETWAVRALDAVLERVAETSAAVGDRFPLYADPDSGEWTTTGRGSWTGGCWAGLLWLRARRTGRPADRELAVRTTARLAPWVEADTAARGLILWYGTALADDPGSARLRTAAAEACRAAYEPALGLVPWGSAFGGPRLLARPDGAPGTARLLALVDPAAATSHLATHLRLCLDHGTRRYDGPEAGWVPAPGPGPGWSRGRAWLHLAAADAGPRSTRGPGMPSPLSLPSVPPADTDAPVDTSAAAVTAVALLRAGRREAGTEVLRAVVRGHLRAGGRLVDGCYEAERGLAVRHELVWGTFFLAAGLAVTTGLAHPTEL
ncbi:sugar ABC transporter permease [Streptomyces sp. NPDC097619]|uniref:sugar ABC transporter permease n=1 Tax=Streptomyces sp. NPDC097619 TaxID=3157228 RepID=UPI00331C5558